MPNTTRLIYVHDPMCSWCWGFRPTFTDLCRQLPARVKVARLLGGLAPDSDQAMPAELQSKLQDAWRRIQTRIPGTRFNFDFWDHCKPRRSTWPACRAVIVARQTDHSLEDPMIQAIQQAYYLDARNPSDTDTLVSLASQLGLDGADFASRLHTAETRVLLEQEIAQARRIGADSFPSLRLQIGDSFFPVPVDYTQVEPMLESIQALLEN